jgi:small-conductance mechanosensitive channel
MFTPIGQIVPDSRLISNLIAVHVLVLFWLGISVTLRWMLTRGAARMAQWSNSEGLKKFSDEATRRGRAILFWSTVGAMCLSVIVAVTYHLMGYDARGHLSGWYGTLRHEHFIRFGFLAGILIGMSLIASALVRTVRRGRAKLEATVLSNWGNPKNEVVLRQWFGLFQIVAVAGVRLGAVWIAFHLAGYHEVRSIAWVAHLIGLLIQIGGTIALARLLSLAWRATSHLVAAYGNAHAANSTVKRFWERVTRLFPLGESCFDYAVYIAAASFVVRDLHDHGTPAFGPYVGGLVQTVFRLSLADLGQRIVECIGIFFGTRVLIELCQVLLNEGFGVHRENRPIDQKAQTLLPLLYSVSQYFLYFGSGVAMLHVLGLDTTPLIAGAGILGLGVGMGAQSLVTDVVSGFFILFENQFLVGDYVNVNDAAGTVEEVSIRVTKIRDGQGKLHIIPNGQIKAVISYSKGYVNAVVDVKLAAGGDLEGLIRSMKEAGRRMKAQRHEVLADTEIHGLVEWAGADMTIRAVTRVEPGTHGIIQNEYRRILKQVIEEKPAAAVGPALAA